IRDKLVTGVQTCALPISLVGKQVLLTDIGDVGAFGILREEVVERLVLGRAQRLGDGVVPFVAVGEFGVDVEHDAAEVEQPVTNDFADGEPGNRHIDLLSHPGSYWGRTFERFKRGHAYYLGNAWARC